MPKTRDSKAYKKIREQTTHFRRYFTHDNGGRPFLVYYRGGHAFIYKRPPFDEKAASDKEYEDWEKGYAKEWAYTVLVKEFKYDKVFVGESPLNYMTSQTGSHGREFKGNSIVFSLIKHRSSDRAKVGRKMLFVGDMIYEWRYVGEPISYCSPVGDSDVPYPFMKTRTHVLFMLDKVYMPLSLFRDDSDDLYSEFYDLGRSERKRESKPFQDLEIIHPRIW